MEFGLAVKFKCLCLKFELAHGNRGALSWCSLFWWRVFLVAYLVIVFDCYLREFNFQVPI